MIRSELPICPASLTVDPGPVSWWDIDADKSLVVGTYLHGYERYDAMKLDPYLTFIDRANKWEPQKEIAPSRLI